MTDTAKVIRLEPEVQRHVRARLARLPAGVHAFNEAGKKLLADGLVEFFDATDDALFDMADKAQSNQDQNLFFDAMREVRVQRKGIERRFFDNLEEAFARLVGEDSRDVLKDSGELSADALSLVQNDDLEQLVAYEATVTRANRNYVRQLRTATESLSSVVSVAVNEKNYPFGPQVVCVSAMGQIKRLDIDIKAKLVLFKLFDRLVVEQFGRYYKILEEALIANGIRAGKQTSAIAKNTNKLDINSAESVRQERSAETQESATGPQKALLELLAFVQKLPINTAGTSAIDIERILASVQQHRGTTIKLRRIEKETINLVQMMFQFILRDSILAEPLKELICRLQVPVLKVALTDPSFVVEKRHPARRLLNELTGVALQWNGQAEVSREEPLYLFLKSTVDRITSQFSGNNDVFREALADFSSVIEKDRRRSAVLERRTIDAEDGKARAEQARKTVASEVKLRTMAYHLPAVVQELIQGPWSNVLFVTGLKFGFTSAEWHEQLKVLGELVWSVQACNNKSDRQRLIRMIPELIQRMRRGLDAISYNPFEVSELFTGLEEIHLMRIRGEPLPEESVVDSGGEAPVELTALTVEEMPDMDDGLQDKSRSEAAHLDESDPQMRAVSNFAQGAWFDLDMEGDATIRCRLAAFIKPTGKYIFVNRGGMKAAEKTQIELAVALKNGQLRALDNAMLFDKALESVVTSLRKPQSNMRFDLNE